MNLIKRLKIFYFSGTGNAKRIATWFSELAIDENVDCQIYNISEVDIKSMDTIPSDVLIMIISPVHGFNYPKITLNFIEHFPKGNNCVILMDTRAGMRIGNFVTPGLSGVTFLLSSFLLQRKGYNIVGQVPFDMPSNWISVHPALNEKTVKFLHEKNYDKVKKHAGIIFSGHSDFFAYRDLLQDILITPVSLGYYYVGRFFFAKSFYATNACNNCGICGRECPVHAIKNSKGLPFWTFKCESCMKCMNICSRRAIESAHGLWVVLITLSSLLTGLFYNFLNLSNHAGLIKFVFFNIIFLALLRVFYRIQYLFLKNKIIGKLIALTSLTHYKFWGRYYSNFKNNKNNDK